MALYDVSGLGYLSTSGNVKEEIGEILSKNDPIRLREKRVAKIFSELNHEKSFVELQNLFLKMRSVRRKTPNPIEKWINNITNRYPSG